MTERLQKTGGGSAFLPSGAGGGAGYTKRVGNDKTRLKAMGIEMGETHNGNVSILVEMDKKKENTGKTRKK